MNVSNTLQQSNYTSQLQSSSSVQSQSAVNKFSPETSQMTNRSIMDSPKFSDIAQLLAQNSNGGESGEVRENDGDSDDGAAKATQSKSLANAANSLNTLLQSNNTQQSNNFQSILMKNILSAYGVSNTQTHAVMSQRA